MSLKPKIEFRQRQSVSMTPQLQQAIKLLQMSNLELAGFVAAAVERNPLLELASRAEPRAATNHGSPRSGEPTRDWIQQVTGSIGLREHLLAQIGTMRATASAVEAALAIIGELEDDGYLRSPLDEVGVRHGLPDAALQAGLALVQACEPPGVGARNLRECLALQLVDRGRLDPAMAALLERLPLVALGRYGELQELCGVDAEDLSDMLAELRALDPRPGLRFEVSQPDIAVPDVYVQRAEDGSLAVELNTETLPRVLVNNVYAIELGRDAAARPFVSECSAGANWLVRSLEQRARTILRVATEIVRRQEGFFAVGLSQMRPLTQREVARTLGLHESTVSRVTAGKYLSCDRGCFEFRYFFSTSVQAVSGGETFSAVAVQEMIRSLVTREPATRPLSDDKIVVKLKSAGIDIARRTVAKYREGMGIPSSVERRRLRAGASGDVARAFGGRD